MGLGEAEWSGKWLLEVWALSKLFCLNVPWMILESQQASLPNIFEGKRKLFDTRLDDERRSLIHLSSCLRFLFSSLKQKKKRESKSPPALIIVMVIMMKKKKKDYYWLTNKANNIDRDRGRGIGAITERQIFRSMCPQMIHRLGIRLEHSIDVDRTISRKIHSNNNKQKTCWAKLF